MQLDRLKIQNIRSYASAEVGLGPGTTLIVGDVGSGKTSLLYAIEMALFGFAEVDPVHLVRHKARQAEVELEIVDPEHRYILRRRFSRRTRKGRDVFEPDECSFGTDGHVARYSPTEVRQRAIDLLGFPDNPNPRAHSDLWRWAVYIPQERMREVLSQEPSERRETVRKALGLERYKVAADNAALLAREINGRARDLDGRAAMLEPAEAEAGRLAAEADRLSRDLDRLRSEGDVVDRDLEAAERAVAIADEAARAAAVDRARLAQLAAEEQRELERARGLATGLDDLRRRIAEAEGELATLDSARAEFATAEAERDAAQAEVDRWTAAEAQSSAIERGRVAAEAGLRAAQGAVDVADADRRRAEAERNAARERRQAADHLEPRAQPEPPEARTVPELRALLVTSRRTLEERQAEETGRRHVLADLEVLLSEGTCPRCGQPVRPEEFAGHRAEAAESVRSAEASTAHARAEAAAVEARIAAREAYELAMEAARRNEERRREAERAEADAEVRLARAEQALHEAVARRSSAEAELGRWPSTAETDGSTARALAMARRALAGAQQRVDERARRTERERALGERRRELEAERDRRSIELSDLSSRASSLTEQRAALEARARGPDREADLLTARIHHKAVQERRESLGRTLARSETELRGTHVRLAEARSALARRSQLRADADAERAMATFLLGPFREGLLNLEERMLTRAQHEFERTFASAFRTLVEDPMLTAQVDASFSPSVEIDGEWTPAEALSGGERTALAFAFRVALGQTVRGAGRLRLDTLLLDEPTDGFSPEQVTRLGELLGDLAIPQVILVSHEASLASIADRVVRIEKHDGLSIARPEGETSRRSADPPATLPTDPGRDVRG